MLDVWTHLSRLLPKDLGSILSLASPFIRHAAQQQQHQYTPSPPAQCASHPPHPSTNLSTPPCAPSQLPTTTPTPSSLLAYLPTLDTLSLTPAETSMILLPVIAYWLFSSFFYWLSKMEYTSVELHRIKTDQKGRGKNRVTMRQ
ncbi:hypothetical protein HK104_010466, partial [Borealophlyctis nickersoniae]